jgi:hypothetical protein
MKKKSLVLLSFVGIILLYQACRNDKVETNLVNELYEESTATGLSYFKNASLLAGVSPSPHGSFKLKFNAIAQAALDSTGELPVGKTFPEGSLIVKDIYSGSTLSLIAIMKKDASSDYAGNGWVWVEFKPDGETEYSIEKKGEACTGCHSGTPNRDLTRTFDLH